MAWDWLKTPGSFFGPSDEAKRQHDTLAARWDEVWARHDRCSGHGETKGPRSKKDMAAQNAERRTILERHYQLFKDAGNSWEVAQLNAMAIDLSIAEKELEDAGCGAPAAPIPGFDIEDGSEALKTAVDVDKGAKVIEDAAHQAADVVDNVVAPEVEKANKWALGVLWKAIPLPAKIAGGVVLVVLAAGQVAPAFTTFSLLRGRR